MQTEENIYANPVPLPDEPILESFKKFIKKDDSDERLLAFLAKESEIVLRKRELRGLTAEDEKELAAFINASRNITGRKQKDSCCVFAKRKRLWSSGWVKYFIIRNANAKLSSRS